MSSSAPQKSTANTDDKIILEQGKRIRALHEIISRPDLSFDQQIDETLRLGCQLLGTEIGKVGRLNPATNESEFLNTIVMSDLPARRGIVLPLDKTFCNITFLSQESLVISNVDESEYRSHPAVEFLGMHSYIGCSINVHGKKFGTVNFSNRTPVENAFTDADTDLVNLIGSWISVMMERQEEAEELRKSKEEAERANQVKSSFLANMSHEIRTPLTAIIGFADTAVQSKKTEEQRLDALQKIRRSGDHLLHLINDILDLSKVEAEEMDIDESPVNIFRLVSDLENILVNQAKRKGIDFIVDFQYPVPAKIQSDALRIKQILLNLVGNAIKFTDSGSVTISIAYSEDAGKLTFKIKDSGIGLSPEQVDKIFLPFRQADSTTTSRFGGTGLGLSLSRKLSHLLNGEITASGEPGVGSTFEFTLPVNFNAEQASLALVTSNENDADSHEYISGDQEKQLLSGEILLAEDDELNQELIAMYLEDMGADVTLAENGKVAVELASEKTFDLIYMDMQMPLLSGYDAVKQLRENNYTAPIVMLTANVTLEDRNKCQQVGSDEFVTKPIEEDRLYEVTARYLKKSDAN